MSTQESAGDASHDDVGDIVDAFPSIRLYSQLDPDRSTAEEAMEIQNTSIDEKSEAYKMNHAKRGIALIINNEEFHPRTGMTSRNGSSRDAETMKGVLNNRLGFKVIARNNMTVKQMKLIFEDISADDHTNNDGFVCVILSHGDDGGIIYGTDDKIPLDDLISYILPNKCPSLAGKPKLFFVQACRGTKLDKGVEVHDAMGTIGSSPRITPAKKIPLWADMLIAYSSVPGYYSWRNCRNGSWFIQSLCCILERYGNVLEIQQIMTKVNFHVAYEFESRSNDPKMNRMKQVPCIASMLTKELYFPAVTSS